MAWAAGKGGAERGANTHCFSGDHLSPAPSTPLSLFRAQFMDFPMCRNLENIMYFGKMKRCTKVLKITGSFESCGYFL